MTKDLDVNPQKSPSRHGRYRKELVPSSFFEEFAATLVLVFKDLWQLKEQKEINESEFVGYGLLTMLLCRRSDAFQKHKTTISRDTEEVRGNLFAINDFVLLLDKYSIVSTAFHFLPSSTIGLEVFLQSIRFRGVPDSARLSLLQWVRNDYPLKLLTYIPSVDEVFAMQMLGNRCVTFFLETKELCIKNNGRDALSFIVHDLIHAHEFYENRVRTKQQIGFYRWLYSISDNEALRNLIKHSKPFKDYWDYLRSDMNSYCGHLMKTLHAALTIHSKEINEEFNWDILIESSDLIEKDKVLFKRINALDWEDQDFLQLESVFESMVKDS